MRKPSSKTLLDYSILLLAVSPELYGIIIVCTPPFLLGVVLRLLLNFQKGGLDRISVFRGGIYCWTFREGCSFYIKNKLKSDTFNDKKVHKQKSFSVTNKNLNWEITIREIITKNLVTFKLLKDETKLRMKNFNIIGVHWKILF